MRPYRKADQSPGELAVKVITSSKTGMAGMPHNDVIENFDLQELARSIPVRFRPSPLADKQSGCEKGSIPFTRSTDNQGLTK